MPTQGPVAFYLLCTALVSAWTRAYRTAPRRSALTPTPSARHSTTPPPAASTHPASPTAPCPCTIQPALLSASSSPALCPSLIELMAPNATSRPPVEGVSLDARGRVEPHSAGPHPRDASASSSHGRRSDAHHQPRDLLAMRTRQGNHNTLLCLAVRPVRAQPGSSDPTTSRRQVAHSEVCTCTRPLDTIAPGQTAMTPCFDLIPSMSCLRYLDVGSNPTATASRRLAALPQPVRPCREPASRCRSHGHHVPPTLTERTAAAPNLAGAPSPCHREGAALLCHCWTSLTVPDSSTPSPYPSLCPAFVPWFCLQGSRALPFHGMAALFCAAGVATPPRTPAATSGQQQATAGYNWLQQAIASQCLL